MKTLRRSRSSLLFGSACLALGVALGSLGTLAVQPAEAGKPSQGPLERKEFHSTLDVVLDRYVEPVDAPEVMARGLKHMVSGLDPHSHYLTADERTRAQKLQRQGASAGLVTALDHDGSGAKLEIVAVDPGGPAAALGLDPGDRIVEIAGRPCDRLLSNVEAQMLLSGAAGQQLDLVLERGQGPESLTITLAKPSVTALVAAELLEQSGRAIAKIEIHGFRSGTGELVKQALAEQRRSAADRGFASLSGVILDVRGNPGGEVAEAVLVADLFVGEGVLTRTRGRGGVILREELATAAGTDSETPLVVLQDRRSASAAELLAVALQDNGRATVVGERSYGKGTVQELIAIPDGSLLTLTVARYFSPDDRLIDGKGVDPDVVLEQVVGDAAVQAAARELVARIDDSNG